MIIVCGYVDSKLNEYLAVWISTLEAVVSTYACHINPPYISKFSRYQQNMCIVDKKEFDNFCSRNTVENTLLKLLQPCGYPLAESKSNNAVETATVFHSIIHRVIHIMNDKGRMISL